MTGRGEPAMIAAMIVVGRQPLRILIADDQPQVRSALRLLIENQEDDWDIAGEAADYPDLLTAVEKQPADLILLDWELPGLLERQQQNSCTIAEQITRLRAGRAIVIVAISGYGEARQQAGAAGADAFVSKTDPPDRFLAVLKNAGMGRL